MGSNKPRSAVDSLPDDYENPRGAGSRRDIADPLTTTDGALVIGQLTDEKRAARRAAVAWHLVENGVVVLAEAFAIEDLEVYRFDRDRIADELPAVLEWVRANGLMPEFVPADAIIVIDGDWLTVDTFVDFDGNPSRPEYVGGAVRRGSVTVQLAVRPHLASLTALAVPKAKPAGPVPPAPPSSVPCPQCPGRIGEPCISARSGKPWNGYHTARRRRANKAVEEKGAAA